MKYIDIAYIVILGCVLGAVLTLGVLVAPVVFNTEMLFNKALLSHYQEGVIMSEVFRRFGYVGYAIALFVAIYEAIQFKQFKIDKISIISALFAIGSALLFSAVYVKKILTMQAYGPEVTQSEAFENLHKASEIDFKVLAAALLVLMVRRVYILSKSNV